MDANSQAIHCLVSLSLQLGLVYLQVMILKVTQRSQKRHKVVMYLGEGFGDEDIILSSTWENPLTLMGHVNVFISNQVIRFCPEMTKKYERIFFIIEEVVIDTVELLTWLCRMATCKWRICTQCTNSRQRKPHQGSRVRAGYAQPHPMRTEIWRNFHPDSQIHQQSADFGSCRWDHAPSNNAAESRKPALESH